MRIMSGHVIEKLSNISNPNKAKILQSFFKTDPGQYGYGDLFWGITVPQIRAVARLFQDISLKENLVLIQHQVHEIRLCALLILVHRFQEEPSLVYKTYIDYKKFVNNWDLVDLTADKIVGAYLRDKPKTILYALAKSQGLWDRRIAIVSTFSFIKSGESQETFKIADLLMRDQEDLIHKAVGWMLREVGKRCSMKELENYLKFRYKKMPRTMLRYAIERFEESLRKKYLLGTV